MKILVDLDSTIADLYTPWLAMYNEKYGDNLTIERVKNWFIHDFTKPECGVALYKLLNTEGLFANLKPLAGALEAVKELHDDGHEIVICSSATWPLGAKEKTTWVQEHMPYVDRNNVILAGNKHHVHGDVLIDDSPEQHDKYRKTWPRAKIIGIAWPYNEGTKFDLRADSYLDTAAAWRQIVEYVTWGSEGGFA